MTSTGPAKRGRKPRGAAPTSGSPRVTFQDPSPNFQNLQWAHTTTTSTSSPVASNSTLPSFLQGSGTAGGSRPQSPAVASSTSMPTFSTPSFSTSSFATASAATSMPTLDMTGLLKFSTNSASTVVSGPIIPPPPTQYSARVPGGDDDGEADDELFPAMADDDYSAQLSWQSQSKDNLKVLMDNLSPQQYDRFEAYRRHALPKQAVRKVIQQTTGQQVSMPVAQIVAGFSKVFVGEIIEKARAVQSRRGETGPLSPDHLREAYRMYQEETGRVGAARPVRAKRLFVR